MPNAGSMLTQNAGIDNSSKEAKSHRLQFMHIYVTSSSLIFHHNLLNLLVHSSKQKVVYKHQSQYSASAELSYL